MEVDLYVDEIAEETGKLFEHLCENNYDMNNVVSAFMNSEFRELVDNRNPYWATMGYKKIFIECQTEFDKYKLDYLQYDPVLCNWIGMAYTYLQCHTGLSSKAIYEKIKFNDLYARSKGMHDFWPNRGAITLADIYSIKERSNYNILERGL